MCARLSPIEAEAVDAGQCQSSDVFLYTHEHSRHAGGYVGYLLLYFTTLCHRISSFPTFTFSCGTSSNDDTTILYPGTRESFQLRGRFFGARSMIFISMAIYPDMYIHYQRTARSTILSR